MAKDVLNKSKLDPDSERIMNEVLYNRRGSTGENVNTAAMLGSVGVFLIAIAIASTYITEPFTFSDISTAGIISIPLCYIVLKSVINALWNE